MTEAVIRKQYQRNMLISVEVFVADAVSSTHGEPLEHFHERCDTPKIHNFMKDMIRYTSAKHEEKLNFHSF